MQNIPQVAAALQRTLTTTAKAAGQASNFVQRASKMDGAAFVQTLTFGWMANPAATLEELAQTAAVCGVEITPQGLDQRCTLAGAECLRLTLEAAVQQVVESTPQALPILQRFSAVTVLDSTSITLPDELKTHWPGQGGDAPSGAALKLQVRLELSSGRLEGPLLQAGKDNDPGSAGQQLPVAKDSLRLADLGYWSVKRFADIGAAGGFWLSRLQAGTRVFDQAGAPLDLGRWLAQQAGPEVETPIELSAQHHLPCRLLAEQVPATVSAQRRRKLRLSASKHGRTPSRQQLLLCDWTVLVTNVPPALLSGAEALVVRRLRWQIELLFKAWKSHGHIDESRSRKPARILCEVYAKLLGLVLQHWVVLTSEINLLAHGLDKALKTIQKFAYSLTLALFSQQRLGETLHLIARTLNVGSRKNKRKGKPSALQLLSLLADALA
ncbi:MAG TPA: IS4 family transposase [Blastocatellia bacterium]|nr:IS4 family transposase [Blastocatellia bacterium]